MPVSSVGSHLGKIISIGLKKAKSSGNVQVVIQFEDEEGHHVTAYLATTEKAWQYTEQKLIACGWVPADNDYDLTKLNDPDCSLVGMKDIPFQVDEQKDLNGEMQRRVSWIGEGAIGISERMSTDETKVFAAQLRQRLVARGGQKTAPAPKAATKAGSPPPWKR